MGRLQELRSEIREAAAGVKRWLQESGLYFLLSAVVHCLLLVLLGFLSLWAPQALSHVPGPSFDAASVEATSPLERFQVGDTPIEPSALTPEMANEFQPPAQTAQFNDDSPIFEEAGGGMAVEKRGPELGGLGGFALAAGPGAAGRGGVGFGIGEGTNPGSGGAGVGFAGRGSGHRDALLGAMGGTKGSDRAVLAALNWLARHQSERGNWSLQYQRQCAKGETCSGDGFVKSDVAATGLALLAFLGAGHTHKTPKDGIYRQHVSKGLAWLIGHQAADGRVTVGPEQQQLMYSHGIATIALCEAYGMTRDTYVGAAANKALRFIEHAQNTKTGGWRYDPGAEGDTSVTGWQVMALKSGQLAGLSIDSQVWQRIPVFLKLVRKGAYGGLYNYLPYNTDDRPAMTAVGMLCDQYMGTTPEQPRMGEGRDYLLAHLPDLEGARNIYYWYYATLAMHNLMGPPWDTWNRSMRKALIQSQVREGCAMGSWDPEQPSLDSYGDHGGRLMVTAMSALTLEIYYRYLPLYMVEAKGEVGGPAHATPPAGPEPPAPEPAAENGPGAPEPRPLD